MVGCGRTQVYAGALLRERERELAEMSRNQRVYQIVPVPAFPPNQIFCGNQNAPITRLSTAHAALEAIEIRVVYGRGHAPEVGPGLWRGRGF